MSYIESGFDNNLIRLGYSATEPEPFYDSANIGSILGAGSIPTTAVGALDSATDDDGNWINELINTKLDTASKEILGDFTFGASGAISISTDPNNGLWISPTGILGKKAGSNTFAIDNTGNATFGGILSAASGTLGALSVGSNAWHVDASGNMWWGSSADYASATIKISSTGSVSFTSGTFRGSLNADDITAGTLTGRTVKAKGTGSTSDVWIDGDGTVKFYYGSSQIGYIYSSTSAQILFYSSNDLYLQTADQFAIDSGSAVSIFADSYITMNYNDNGGTDSFSLTSAGASRLTLDSSGNLNVVGNIQCGNNFKSSDGTSGSNHAGYGFVNGIRWSGSTLQYRFSEITVKDGLITGFNQGSYMNV